MAENLPLIPEKGSALCADVRPVLRGVFKGFPHFPPLAPEPSRDMTAGQDGDNNPMLPKSNKWIEKYKSDRKEIWTREGELQQKYAKRIFRDSLPNIYRLYPSPQKRAEVPAWETEQGILGRRDLMPSLAQNADVDNTLWVKNILNRSSCDLTPMVVRGSKLHEPIRLNSPKESTLQSISIGELMPRPSVTSLSQFDSSPSDAPPVKECILCVPSQIDFVNYTVGLLHTEDLRLVNVSNSEVRLAIRPPTSPELKIELLGARGLTVTSGAAAELRIHFRPREVHVVHDVIFVRVSTGTSFNVPISCYMVPPLLDILIPAVNPSILSYTPGNGETSISRNTDCLELGAKLLGDVHSVVVVFHCEAEHAGFFMITEDAWLSFSLDELTTRGSLLAAPFVVWPALWQGGGSVRGNIWCRAGGAGLQAAALRILCSTAVVRPLSLIADSLYFKPEHITLVAHEKNYDICSDDDPACEYYVHLGTAFPQQPLSATVQLVNHSPVIYSYYWSVRPWGACVCAEDEQATAGGGGAGGGGSGGGGSGGGGSGSDAFCVGAQEAGEQELKAGTLRDAWRSARRIRAEPAHACAAPRASGTVRVRAAARRRPGPRRAVLMLVLKDIPRESLPAGYDPFIVRTNFVESDAIPGVKRWSREVCEIVCTQMEVWWEVAPARFVLDPPRLLLRYSRRMTAIDLTLRATQLFGCESICCSWKVPPHVPLPPPMTLTAAHSCEQTLKYPLPPNSFPETDIITLKAASDEWQSRCSITRQCSTRHPALRPPHLWLGIVHPGAEVLATLELVNVTFQHIWWWAEPFRWAGAGAGAGTTCAGAACAACWCAACGCAAVRRAPPALRRAAAGEILYREHAPLSDGIVATLIQVRWTSADVAQERAGGEGGDEGAGGAGGTVGAGCAALLAYRVLAPRLLLRVLPCQGDKRTDCEGCGLDEGARPSKDGTALLRPKAALALSRRTCYKLRFTNLTPLPTRVTWDPALEDDALKVFFVPEEFDVGKYGQVDIQVVLEARRVCGRRLYIRRAQVLHAYKPIYLVIDAAIAGIEIVCELPLGGGEKTESTAIIRRTQAEQYPWDADKVIPRTPKEIFEQEDKKRAENAENVCHCKVKLVFIEPKKRARPPPQHDEDYPPIEIVLEPPPKTRLCRCYEVTKPILTEHEEPICLQFHQLPVGTERTRILTICNESVLPVAWTTAVRRWPTHRHRSLDDIIHPDQWEHDVPEPGAAVQCTPAAGALGGRRRRRLRLRARAAAAGVYWEQLLINIENLEAIVVDVWVEAVGAALQVVGGGGDPAAPATCWMSATDPRRSLRVGNVSRADLAVHAYTLTEHEHPQDVLPFRLYLRLFDVLPAICPKCRSGKDELDGESIDGCVSTSEVEMDTGFEIYLAPDYGLQNSSFYKVRPETARVRAGSRAAWAVGLQAPPHGGAAPPPSALLLRPLPLHRSGAGWYRPEPPAELVRLRHTEREGRLELSCPEIRVKINALRLPFDDVMRVRKPFRVRNVGNGSLEISASTAEPWAVTAAAAPCRCGPGAPAAARHVRLSLAPRASLEVCAEVQVRTAEAWPAAAPYEQWRRTTTDLLFYDGDNVLRTLPLTLELEYPKLVMEPQLIDFGFVTDGDTRKSYFSITHSCRTEALDLVTECIGGDEFRLWPKSFTLHPGRSERIYIQYTARWCGAAVERAVAARARCGAGAWCRAAGRARAAAARDRATRAATGDHTDDARLLPPCLLSLPS